MARVSVAWQGWPGSPGVTQLYMAPSVPQASVDAVRSFFAALVGLLPSGLTINVPSSGDLVEDQNGKLSGTWSVGVTPAPVIGNAAAAYSGVSGAVVHWLTAGVANGRRVRGRTFLVPLTQGAYDTSGSLLGASLTTIQNAAAGLVTGAGGNFLVWHRNTAFAQGSSFPVTSSRVPDLAVALRSRRT